ANWPSLVVVVTRSILVAASVALTVAPGTTAPDGSVTVPLMAPRNVCEFATTANDNVNNTAVKKRFMSTLPCRSFDHSWHGKADFAFPKRTSAAARPRLVALFKAIYGCTGQYGLLKASYSSEKVAVNKNFRRRELKFL